MKRQLRINIPMNGYKKGFIIKVDCDDSGIPLDPFWRRRVNDSKVDSCVEFVEEETAQQTSSKKKGG